ncbi:hypothetical protein RJ640_023548 [Escallonia rubra]|uniref:Retroviral polymerase SH3-like domain-containing protein n=1 Tax=Escallonia rubra TaxID=112253 RepID=A0AA88UGU0_9ASTE|nr:hypothetical protein RJ640_023548 [Escallonia rubra]
MDPAQPISIILDGSNYILWAQAMHSFIKGKKLWRYLTGDITIPVKTADEPQLKFDERLDYWDSKNHQIITWFRNTSVLSIYQQFGRYNTAKEIWDLLAQRYTTTDLAHQYQLHDSLHRMKQEPGQSINSFLSHMQGIWDQLELSEPSWTYSEDSAHFIVYRDHLRLIQFLMSLTDAYESVRSSLLHRSLLPTSRPSADSLCRKIGAGHFPQDCPRNPEKWSKNPSPTSAPPKPGNQSRFKPSSHFDAVADDVLNDSPSSTLSVNDVAEIVKQIMSNSGTPSSSALSVTSGNPSWYFDSGCCNHMTFDPFSFISKQHLSHYPLIHTGDGSHMHVDHVGHDPETGQTIGIGRKVGRLFELINLSIPHRPTIPPQSAASVTSQNSLELWHSRLGYGIEHKGYRCWDPISNRLRISRHVVFWEHKMFSSIYSFHLPPLSSVPFFTNSYVPLFYDSDETHIPPYDDFTAPPEMSARPTDPVAPDQGPPFITFSSHSSLELHAYSDADWAGDPTDRRSTTDFCFFLGTSLISWRSKKQNLTARSSTEAEYRVLTDTTHELLWLHWLLEDMGVTHSAATPLYCDNRSAIEIAHNDVFHERTKHNEIDCHFRIKKDDMWLLHKQRVEADTYRCQFLKPTRNPQEQRHHAPLTSVGAECRRLQKFRYQFGQAAGICTTEKNSIAPGDARDADKEVVFEVRRTELIQTIANDASSLTRMREAC